MRAKILFRLENIVHPDARICEFSRLVLSDNIWTHLVLHPGVILTRTPGGLAWHVLPYISSITNSRWLLSMAISRLALNADYESMSEILDYEAVDGPSLPWNMHGIRASVLR